MDRTDTSLIALRRILRATELYGRDLARTHGLTPVQIRVLQIVFGPWQRHAQADPRRRWGVSQATISTLIDRLVAKGVVRARTVRSPTAVRPISSPPRRGANVDRVARPIRCNSSMSRGRSRRWKTGKQAMIRRRAGARWRRCSTRRNSTPPRCSTPARSGAGRPAY